MSVSIDLKELIRHLLDGDYLINCTQSTSEVTLSWWVISRANHLDSLRCSVKRGHSLPLIILALSTVFADLAVLAEVFSAEPLFDPKNTLECRTRCRP